MFWDLICLGLYNIFYILFYILYWICLMSGPYTESFFLSKTKTYSESLVAMVWPPFCFEILSISGLGIIFVTSLHLGHVLILLSILKGLTYTWVDIWTTFDFLNLASIFQAHVLANFNSYLQPILIKRIYKSNPRNHIR